MADAKGAPGDGAAVARGGRPALAMLCGGAKMAEAVVELLERAAGREAPLEELRALRLAVQAVPPAALRARLSDDHLGALFALLSVNDR